MTSPATPPIPAQDSQYHFGIVKRAIQNIDAGDGTPLPLETLAKSMNMSPAHFQRVFSRWAGVSPKRFQQYLAIGHAKSLLHNRFSTLETSHSVGLSGNSRLHDLFLRWEAMSPGDYARQGAGLTIRTGWFDSPFGRVLAMGTDKGLCGIGFADDLGETATYQDLATRWPKADFVEDPAAITAWVEAAFGLSGQTNLHLIGAPFQIKVWEALMSIPTGHVTTYSEIAQAIGSPKAVRAVGTAVGRNPIALVIPCHRALRKSGGLGGYHWGLPLKRAILAWESAQADSEAAEPKTTFG